MMLAEGLIGAAALLLLGGRKPADATPEGMSYAETSATVRAPSTPLIPLSAVPSGGPARGSIIASEAPGRDISGRASMAPSGGFSMPGAGILEQMARNAGAWLVDAVAAKTGVGPVVSIVSGGQRPSALIARAYEASTANAESAARMRAENLALEAFDTSAQSSAVSIDPDLDSLYSAADFFAGSAGYGVNDFGAYDSQGMADSGAFFAGSAGMESGGAGGMSDGGPNDGGVGPQ